MIFLFISKIDAEENNNNCPEIVSKKRWGGRMATFIKYQILPVKYVIIHHTVTDSCDSRETRSKIVENIQTYHMDNLGYDDIGYKCAFELI